MNIQQLILARFQRHINAVKWKKRFFRPVLALSLFIFCNTLYSQKVTTLLSKDKIVIGEQIELKLKVEGINPGGIKEDFRFPDTINRLEILKDSIEWPDAQTLLHTLTITGFDSGYWQIPAFRLVLSDGSILVSDSLGIAVLPVDVSGLQDYHDIKDILEVSPGNNWWAVMTIILTGLLSLFALLWFMNNRSIVDAGIAPQASDPGKAHKNLLRLLAELEDVGLTDQQKAKLKMLEIVETSKEYFGLKFQQNPVHLTSSEYMLAMRSFMHPELERDRFFQLLRLSDAVKFAKYQPRLEEIREHLPPLRVLVETIHQKTLPS